MYDFFISHSKTVKESIAIPITQWLSRIGFSPWIDRQMILSGDYIYANIKKALSEVKYGIAIIDFSYLHNNWTMQELELLHQRELIEKKNFIIPIFVSIDKMDIYNIIPWLEGRAFEKIHSNSFDLYKNLDCFSRIIAQFYNDNISINSLDSLVPILNNQEFPCKNALIELIKAKYYLSSDLRLAIIELCNIQGLIYGICMNLDSGMKANILITAHHFSKILQDYCYDNSYILDYNVYFSYYKAVLASATSLIDILNFS